MKVLVTGANGFIGRYLVNRLLKENYEVYGFLRKESEFFKGLKIKTYLGDILDKEKVENAVKGKEIIFHLVGIGDVSKLSREAYEEYKKVNVEGTKNILEACIKNKKVKKIIYFSSTAAMGLLEGLVNEKTECNPQTPYQLSKFESEKLIFEYYKKHKLPIVILRPSMIYGKGTKNSQILEIYKFVKKRVVPLIGDGKNNIPLIHVEDVVEAAILASKKGRNGEIYIITNNEKNSLKQIINLIKEITNIKAVVIRIPKNIALMLALFLEKILPIITRKRINSMTTDRIFDTGKANKELEWKPKICLREGLSQTLR